MTGPFSLKFIHSSQQSESSADLPTAISSNSSQGSLAGSSSHHASHHHTSKQKYPSKQGSSSVKKLDFKDTKSLKSVKSESSNVSYFGSKTSGDDVIRSNKSQKSKSGGLCNTFNRRYNETSTVYRSNQSKPRSRFSLRNLFYTNPLRSNPFITNGSATSNVLRSLPGVSGSRDAASGSGSQRREADTGSEGSWMERDSQGTVNSGQQNHQDQSSHLSESGMRECVLCLAEYTSDQYHFPALRNCCHLSCIVCLQQYVRIEVQEGRANLKCPQCSQLIHPNDIEDLIGEDVNLLGLYQFLMVRRVLAADPDTRWCPAPNCTYAVIAQGCASCPKIDCEREGCNFSFCYHCKAEWHPNITCDQAKAKRHPVRSGSEDSGVNSGGLEVKVCPRCSVLIVKMDDGSCNHMTCAVCGSEFCWLCMKEISDLHYLSPSGCTFWGKKPWSRKKKLLWQLGTIVGAPVGIALIAGISIPAMVIGIPVWVGRRINSRHTFSSKPRRITAITAGVLSSVFVSPVLAGLVVCVGVPCLLAYVYGVVPFSLCRSGGCGLSTTNQGVRIDVDEEAGAGGYRKSQQQTEVRVANPSIGELSLGASLSMGSGSHIDRLVECDRESASNTAIAGYSLTGSVASSYLGQHRLEVGADVHPRKKFSFSSERLSETVSLSEKSATVSLGDDGGASTRALAGSILQYRMENKMENSSVNSYKTGQATPGSSVSANQEIDAVSFRPDTDLCLYPSGDEISVRSVPGAALRSLSPVHGEEVSAALRRSRGRRILEKQHSETSGGGGAEETGTGNQAEGVRFDSHVTCYLDSVDTRHCYLDTSLDSQAEQESERSRLVIKKGDLDPETLREETAEELAMVVSPLTTRARSTSPHNAASPLHQQSADSNTHEMSSSDLVTTLKLQDITFADCVTFNDTAKERDDSMEMNTTSTSIHNLQPVQSPDLDQSNISLVQVDGPRYNTALSSEDVTPTTDANQGSTEGEQQSSDTLYQTSNSLSINIPSPQTQN